MRFTTTTFTSSSCGAPPGEVMHSAVDALRRMVGGVVLPDDRVFVPPAIVLGVAIAAEIDAGAAVTRYA